MKSGVHVGTMSAGDAVSIRFKESSRIEGRRPGSVHVVDSSLAHHYCSVLGVAVLADAEPVDTTDHAEAAAVPKTTDRAMKPPPRGRRG